MEQLAELIKTACQELYKIDIEPELSRPEEQFGDYSTNIALKVASKVNKNPSMVADELISRLRTKISEQRSDLLGVSVEKAGLGFINIKLPSQAMLQSIKKLASSDFGINQRYADKTIVCEYSDPNPFKILHAGHLYTSVVGDAIANLLESAGAKVYRVNFGGDVGRHVAMSLWAIIENLDGENYEKLSTVPEQERAQWLSARYVQGNQAYQDNPEAQSKIKEINAQVYEIISSNDHGTNLARIYWTCRQWSYDYLENFYQSIGIKFDRFYPESETAPLGLEAVNAHKQDGIFEESEGAIVFKGEKFNLHTRVFITKEGLPTYETKDIGLILRKWQDYKFDHSIVITGNDIVEYMKVVLEAVRQFEPQLADNTTHLSHGMVKLAGGVKMSSREGNTLLAETILQGVRQANQLLNDTTDEQVVLAAIKYSFLKQRLGADIIYNPEESVSLQGNSGPYLQYSLVRAKSILRRIGASRPEGKDFEYLPDERSLARKIIEYSEVLDQASSELLPSHLASYLYELAQSFNRFYETSRIADDPRQDIRTELLSAYCNVLQHGLKILGITAPETM